MSAQSSGDYAEALENYYEALKLEEDPYDRSYILYNIGLIYSNNGDFLKAVELCHVVLKNRACTALIPMHCAYLNFTPTELPIELIYSARYPSQQPVLFFSICTIQLVSEDRSQAYSNS